MTTVANNVVALESEHVLQVYKRNPVVFERGRGCHLYDGQGRGYLDLISGVGVCALGHANPRLAAAIAEQATTLIHTSNLYFHPLQGELATRLSDLSGLPRAFFCNSGAEAVEACLKFARRYWYSQKDTKRSGIVAFEHSFHGRTMGALSVTWDDHYRAPFAPLLSNVQFVSPKDPKALLAAVTESTGAIILEPLQGEGGVRPFSQEMADAVKEACRKTGALLIADEIQCGLGRTGRAFYSQALGLEPDLMAVGKALGAGVPIAAALFSERVAQAAAFGDHGSTYGGNLLACRAALVFLEELIDRDLMGHVARIGAHLERGLRSIAARQSIVKEIRGAGLIWGIDLDRPALPVVEAALDLGLLVNRTSDTVVRLLPPYVITESEVNEACALLERALGKVAEGRGTVNASVTLRTASPSDVPAIHRLITDNLEAGHLLPRSIDDVERHVSRFVVAAIDDAVVGCAELAPLSGKVAEVRSLVVDEAFRGRHIGPDLVSKVATTATASGFSTLCAFTHEPSHFVRMGFTIVPHIWVPEKISHDCTGCALFRRCGQHAVMLALRQGVTIGPELPAAIIHGTRSTTTRRLALRPITVAEAEREAEAIPA